MFRDYSAINWDEARKIAANYERAIKEYDEDVWDEMKGIAAGAGLEINDILALNARSEIVLTGKYLEGCTSVALTPPLTINQETIIAQNWDWKPSQCKSLIILKINQKHKPNIMMVTEAGIVGKIGFNSAGLGVCLNALATEERPDGVPLHVILRGILNSNTLSDAINAVGRAKIACAANFLVAHVNGEAIDIEAAPGDFDVLYLEDGFIAHTNHFVSLRLSYVKDTGKRILPDSFVRLGRTLKTIRQKTQKLGIKDVQMLLSDHVEYPDSICRHEDLKDETGLRMATVFSIIMNLDRREMHLAPGNPCSSNYHPYSLPEQI